MQDNLLYFLMVAEDLNITKAAERAFISQQCMSNHIKRLEEAYKTEFFHRKPKLTLTPAGERFAYTLRQMKMLEDNFLSEVSEKNYDFCGKINVGITWSRANILLPPVIARYHELYPNVEVIVHNNITDNLENRLLYGYLDLAISTGIIVSPDIEVRSLGEEGVYLVISENLLKKHFPDRYPACRTEFKQGVELSWFSEVPFVLNTPNERFHGMLSESFQQQNLTPNVVFRSDSSDIRSQLCGRDVGLSLFSELLLQYVNRQNYVQPEDNQLCIFPVKGEFSDYRMIAFYHRNAYQPKYLKAFVDLVAEQSKQFQYLAASSPGGS